MVFISGFHLFRIPWVKFGVTCSDDLVAPFSDSPVMMGDVFSGSGYLGSSELDLWLLSPLDGCDQF